MNSSGTPLGNADLSHKRPARVGRFLYGAAYYPEHWQAPQWERDADRMRAAGFNTVRMSEFAWDRMEPREGLFDFAFFDQAIARLGARGISTILCTPTATPPRWLTAQQPDVVHVDEDGRVMQHGSRQHACLANPTFREYSRRITRAMAEHFAANPHVIGWQTDNEIYCQFSECHCASCQDGFEEFLRARFAGDVGALNAAWGTAFWAQSYVHFGDVSTPRRGKPTHPNPAQMLDYYRYLHDVAAQFQHEQVEILRVANPAWFVTHNGTMPHVDYRGLFTQDLDFLGYDTYPGFTLDPDERPAVHALRLDLTRAWSGNFLVLEHQSGPGGQPPYLHDTPEPGEMRRMVYTSIARGADGVLFFRWRTCRFGAEEYWCGLLDHDDVPRRRYEEARQLGRELAVVGPEVLGTSVAVDCGVAAADIVVGDAHSAYPIGLPGPGDMAGRVHRGLWRRGFAVGAVHPADDLSGLRLYVIPHWEVFDPAWVPGLRRFAEAGGVLVIGARTATRDLNNNVVAETPPGCLAALAGAKVDEYGRQNRPDKRPLDLDLGGRRARSELWYEILAPDAGTEVLAVWRGRHLEGRPALTRRRVGEGSVVYVGTYLTEGVLDLLLSDLVALAGLRPLRPDGHTGVSVVRRVGPGKELLFYLNHGDAAVTLDVPAGTDLVTGARAGGAMTLGPNGVAVIRVQPA